MNTEKLYYADGTLLAFDSEVVACRYDEKTKRYGIELHATAFYPEGGGQPSDKGVLLPENGQAPVQVLDVSSIEKTVVHYTNEPIEPGTKVSGSVDGPHRTHFMQQHTGQHILSGVLYHELGLNTVSVHLGEDCTAIEVQSAELLTDEDIAAAEDKANWLIRSALPLRIRKPGTSGDTGFLRRELKTVEDIRIVEIEGYDAVGCGGVHCESTSGAELVCYAGQEKIRGNVRLSWMIGRRAFEDLREKRSIVSKLTVMYSSPQDRLIGRIEAERRKYSETAYENGLLKTRIARAKIEDLTAKGRSIGGSTLYAAVLDDLDIQGLREIANELTAQKNAVAVLLSRSEKEGNLWLLACDRDNPIDFGKIRGPFLELISGKGGGRPPQWQGSWDPSTPISEHDLQQLF